MAFELMREMGWNWRDYEDTPLYVRQFCWDFILRRRRVSNSRSEGGSEGSDPRYRIRRVKW